jgi:hypothetical protein
MNVSVQVLASTGSSMGTAITTASGDYQVRGLPEGTYYVRTSNSQGFIDGLYSGQACVNCDATMGTPVPLALQQTVSNIDFALTPGGRIAGNVSDAESDDGLADVAVEIYSSTGSFVTLAFTDGSGNYLTGGLVPGTYYARTSNTSGYIDGLYLGEWCVACNVLNGTPIVVTSNTTTPAIDFELELGGRISGRVTDATTGDGVPGATVEIYSLLGDLVASGFTDVDGEYVTVEGLPTDSYYAITANSSGYVDGLYSGQPCVGCDPTTGTEIPVTQGEVREGVDFALTPGGRISGTVSDATTGAPLSFISILVFDDDGDFVASGFTNAAGVYTVQGLDEGTYYARTSNGVGYIDGLFSGAPCVGCDVTTGTPISVSLGATTPNVNFALTPGGHITGRVTDQSNGAGIVGATIQIFNSTGTFVTSAAADGTGRYVARGLATGTYYARVANIGPFIGELYAGITCSNCPPLTGTPISVTVASVTPDIDFTLIEGARIAGHVVADGTSAGLPGAAVQIYTSTGAFVTSTSASGTGSYIVAALAAGTYYARTSGVPGYLDGLYDGFPCNNCTATTGTPINAAEGVTTSDVNFSLIPGGRITGTVTNASSGAPLSSVIVQVYNATGGLVTTVFTNAQGAYATNRRLAAGNYFVRTVNTAGFVDELFNNIACDPTCTVTTGTAVSVSSGVTTANINFALTVP